jgi:phage gp36-like protein
MKPNVKQLAEDLAWEWDLGTKLGSEAIQSVESVAIAARGRVPAVLPLVVGDQGFAGQLVRTRLDDGTDGESYLVTVRVATASGQRAEVEAEFVVVDLSWIYADGATPYLSVREFVEWTGYEEAVRLTDELGIGRVDKPRLVAAIEDAQAVADGWLAARYAVPIAAPVPRLVKSAVLDLARRRLYRLEPPDGVKTAAAEALATLKAIGSGVMKLPQAEEPAAAPTAADPVRFSGAARTYTDGSLDGY